MSAIAGIIDRYGDDVSSLIHLLVNELRPSKSSDSRLVSNGRAIKYNNQALLAGSYALVQIFSSTNRRQQLPGLGGRGKRKFRAGPRFKRANR